MSVYASTNLVATKAIERNHALDGLRAIAASLIVLFHLGLTSLVTVALHGGPAFATFMHGLGSSGVELFFTLSAVVLLRPYLRNERPMNVRQYFLRRIRRLWPPFLGAWLLAGAAVALLSAHPTWWHSAMPDFSWREWSSQAFIVYSGSKAYNFAWWTLTIEVLFYVLAPLLVALLAGRSARTMMFALLASVALAQASSWFVPDSPLVGVATKFFTFASCFLGGMVLATHAIPKSALTLLALAGAVIVAAGAFELGVNAHIGYGFLYMVVVSRALDPYSRVGRLLARPNMVWLGERSYSLFLTHFSVIALACWSTSMLIPTKGAAYFLVSRAVAIVGALLVSCTLFEMVESRFANGLVTVGQWWPGRRQTAGLQRA